MTIFFTVATVSYLPQAITLLDSVKKFHPEYLLYIGLVDYVERPTIEQDQLLNKYNIIQLHELNSPDFDFITSTYSPSELSNCSKVLFAEFFLNQKNITRVIFSDSDMLYFNKLPEPEQNASIIITPHYFTPPPIHFKDLELEVINAGMFNAGFFILNKSEEAATFIQWLKERCIPECVDNRCKGIYFDQTWFNFIPLYFKDSFINKNVGLNIAYWNLHERELIFKNDSYWVNTDNPLIFFHYSGWDYFAPESISKFQHRYTVEKRPDTLSIMMLYKSLLKENFYEEYINKPNYYMEMRKPIKPEKKESILTRFLKLVN